MNREKTERFAVGMFTGALYGVGFFFAGVQPKECVFVSIFLALAFYVITV